MSLNRCLQTVHNFSIIAQLCIDWKITAQFLFSEFATLIYDYQFKNILRWTLEVILFQFHNLTFKQGIKNPFYEGLFFTHDHHTHAHLWLLCKLEELRNLTQLL